jgi:hypothetical protein
MMRTFLILTTLLIAQAAVQVKEPAQKPAPAANLKLLLMPEKTEVVRGESIRFQMTLTNADAAAITLPDASPQNRAFGVRITPRVGPRITADTGSLALREGERNNPPREPAQQTIGPGEKLTVEGDLVAWVGDLEPGEYSVAGTYAGTAGQKAESPRVTIRVAAASPANARTARPSTFVPQQTRDTAWSNRTGAGSDVYLLQASSRNPAVSLSNRLLASIGSLEEPVPSSYDVAVPKVRHILWVSPEAKLQIIRWKQDESPQEPVAVDLPEPNLRVLDTAHTDETGRLDVALASPDGKRAGLMQIKPDNTAAYFPVEAVPAVSAVRSLQWSRDGAMVLAWLSAGGRDVYVATADLESPPAKVPSRKVPSSGYGIANIALAQRYNQIRQSYDILLVLLGLDRGREMLSMRRVLIRTGAVESDERFTMAGLKGMTLYSSALREDFVPVYAFFDSEEGLWVAQPRLGRLTPVSDSTGAPVTKSCFPELIVPPRSSKMPGIYVRYIEGGKRLAVAKIG